MTAREPVMMLISKAISPLMVLNLSGIMKSNSPARTGKDIMLIISFISEG
jgi:hypothetical protein